MYDIFGISKSLHPHFELSNSLLKFKAPLSLNLLSIKPSFIQNIGLCILFDKPDFCGIVIETTPNCKWACIILAFTFDEALSCRINQEIPEIHFSL